MNYFIFKRSFKQAVKKYQGKKQTISFWSTYDNNRKFEYVQPKIDSKRRKFSKKDKMQKLNEWKFERGKGQEPWKKEEWKKKEWKAIGVSIYKGFASVWFGEQVDNEGGPVRHN